MAEDMMIEITGSATKAVSALDKAISKLSELQNTFDKLAPSLTKFTEKLDSIASSSKAISALKGMTDATSKQGLSAANAESKQAMYQARLDRSTVSMDRSAVSSSKLVEAQKKLRESSDFDASNQKFLDNYKYNPTPNTASDVNKYSEPISTDVFPPTPPRGSSALATEMESNRPKSTAFTIDTTQATSAVDKMRTYIDSVTPSITRMSETAQQEFGSLSSELIRISSQIDNQRALYSQLAQAATNAASANGEGSSKYLQLEKRMLSADGAMDRLIVKQEKLKSSMSGISDISGKAGSGMTSFGEKSEKSASKATSGFQKTLNMMEKMFIRIIAFRLFSMLQKSITDGMQNIAQASTTANTALSAFYTSTLYLKNSIAASFMPLIESMMPAITQFIDYIASAFNFLAGLFARIFGGATTVTVAKKANVDYAASLAKTGAAADAAKNSLMGFDEINILSQNKSSSSSGTAGMPAATDMFTTQAIPASTLAFADALKQKLSALQPLFKGLQEVFGGFWDSIKSFAETYLYKWLVDIGDWMAAHPNTMYLLGKGLGYVAIGWFAFKAIKWVANITGISSLIGWLWKLVTAGGGASTALGEGAGLGGVLSKLGISGGWVALAVIALAGLGVGAYLLGQKLKDARIKEEFGNITISSADLKSGLQGMIPEFAKIGPALEAQRESIDTFKKSVDTLADDTNNLYIKIKVDGKIDSTEATQLQTQVKDLVSQTKQYLDKEAGYSLSLWGKVFSSDGTVSANETELLGEISTAGQKAQTKVDEIQKNIQKVLDSGIKNGFLTADQQKYLDTQMAKLQTAIDPSFGLANAKLEVLGKNIAKGGLTKGSYDSVKSEIDAVIKEGTNNLADTQIKAYQDVEKQKVLFGISDAQATTLKQAADIAYAQGKKSLESGAVGQYQAMVNGLVSDLDKNKQKLADEWGSKFHTAYNTAFNEALGGIKPEDATKDQIRNATSTATQVAIQAADDGMGDMRLMFENKNQELLQLLTDTTTDAGTLAQKLGITLPDGFSKGINYSSGNSANTLNTYFSNQKANIVAGGSTLAAGATTAGKNVGNAFVNAIKSVKLPTLDWVTKAQNQSNMSNAGKLAQYTFPLVKWYAGGGIFTKPTVAGFGEDGPEAALPLNDKVFSSIADGISKNSGNGGLNIERLIERFNSLETAVKGLKLNVALYADDRKIAESTNRGNQRIARSTSPTA